MSGSGPEAGRSVFWTGGRLILSLATQKLSDFCGKLCHDFLVENWGFPGIRSNGHLRGLAGFTYSRRCLFWAPLDPFFGVPGVLR